MVFYLMVFWHGTLELEIDSNLDAIYLYYCSLYKFDKQPKIVNKVDARDGGGDKMKATQARKRNRIEMGSKAELGEQIYFNNEVLDDVISMAPIIISFQADDHNQNAFCAIPSVTDDEGWQKLTRNASI